jgi:hypothetical protein
MCQLKTRRKRNTRHGDEPMMEMHRPCRSATAKAAPCAPKPRAWRAHTWSTTHRNEHLALRIVQLGHANSQQGQCAGVLLSAVALEKI